MHPQTDPDPDRTGLEKLILYIERDCTSDCDVSKRDSFCRTSPDCLPYGPFKEYVVN